MIYVYLHKIKTKFTNRKLHTKSELTQLLTHFNVNNLNFLTLLDKFLQLVEGEF